MTLELSSFTKPMEKVKFLKQEKEYYQKLQREHLLCPQFLKKKKYTMVYLI
jgi:hypothetical protein